MGHPSARRSATTAGAALNRSSRRALPVIPSAFPPRPRPRQFILRVQKSRRPSIQNRFRPGIRRSSRRQEASAHRCAAAENAVPFDTP